MPEASAKDGRVTFGTDRLSALCDGVVAITATLLVIDLKVPIDSAHDAVTWEALRGQAHLLLSWTISFVMVGVIWYEQHYVFAHSARTDPLFILITFLQLAAISLIPFGSNMVGSNPADVPAALVFAGIMTANGLLIALNGALLSSRAHLHRSPEAAHLRYRAVLQAATYAAMAVFSIAMAILHHPLAGVAAWIVSPFLLAAYTFVSRGGGGGRERQLLRDPR